MTPRIVSRPIGVLTAALFLGMTTGCERDVSMLEPAPNPTDPEVFLDGFGPGVDYEAFAESKVTALDISFLVTYEGSRSLQLTVPNFGDPDGSFAGGAFTSSGGRDLTGYNALEFWARATMPATLGLAGIGNDNTGTSLYGAQLTDTPLTTIWERYVVPIPLPDKLSMERGLFEVASGPVEGMGYELWLDEVQYVSDPTITDARPAIRTQDVVTTVGSTVNVDGTTVTYDVDGRDVTVQASPYYFTFGSSDASVATVAADGTITVVGTGTATITAALGSVDAEGAVTVSAVEGPANAAPTPTVPAEQVISLFSNPYTNVFVDTWSADFDLADVEDVQIAGDDTKLYTNLVFAAVEFTTEQIDVTAMTHFHMDVWTFDSSEFKIKLVDFGPDGEFGGDDDSEHEITLNESTVPAMTTGAWSVLDIPLSDFVGLTGRTNLAQMILSGSSPTIYVDNVYFYAADGTGGGPEPTVAAPTPTLPEADVVSMFSNPYPDVPVDTWSAEWDDADVADIQVAGDDTKLYTNLVFAGIEATSQPIDASAMTGFHMDIWTPDATAAPAVFKIKLVDFGPDGAFEGGDDSEHEITLDNTTTPAMATGEWASLDIPLSDFTGLTGTGAIAQMILSGDPNTVYVDNVYFYRTGGGGTEPTVAAPTPTLPEADVVSMFSNPYPDVPVDTWSAVWDDADVADIQVAGDDTKLYTNLVFAGIESTSQPIDASAMTGFHMDIWTPDATVAPAVFKIKLVDFGPDGAFEGGDDSEHEITLDDTTTPAMATGEWASLDIPLSDFTGLTGTGAIAQMILSGDPNTVYVDNVYFYRTGGGGGGTGADGATGGPYAISFDDPAITYTLTDFGDASSALEPDPADAGNTVARTTKLVTAMTWAGTTVGGVNITYPFSATETQISMRVRSPDAGIPVRMKVETAGDPTRSVETEAVTTTANAWETLTFDFANEAPGTAPLNPDYTYDMLSVFFNFDTDGATAGEKTYYWDTIEFLGTGGGGNGGTPNVAAPTPTVPEADVVSMFSNPYPDVPVDTWSAGWDNADVADVQVAGDDTKLYTNFVFAGIEATSQPIDASQMTGFHMDIWTPDATAAPAVFKIKLVDFGADGAFEGGDDVEHEITLDDTTTPAMATGEWASLDIPLSDFTGLTTTGHIAQMILSGDPNTVYVDNVYFYR